MSPPVAARASKIVCEVADLKDSSLVPLVEQTMLTVLMVHKEKMDFLSLQVGPRAPHSHSLPNHLTDVVSCVL